MDKLTKAKIVVLRRAYVHIARGQFWHICNALRVAYRTPLEERAAIALRQYISRELGGNGTLETWCHERFGYYKPAAELKADRLAWITWMIRSLEGK